MEVYVNANDETFLCCEQMFFLIFSDFYLIKRHLCTIKEISFSVDCVVAKSDSKYCFHISNCWHFSCAIGGKKKIHLYRRPTVFRFFHHGDSPANFLLVKISRELNFLKILLVYVFVTLILCRTFREL